MSTYRRAIIEANKAHTQSELMDNAKMPINTLGSTHAAGVSAI